MTSEPGFGLLDLWSAGESEADAVAFDAGSEASAPLAATWRLDLPADQGQAEAKLASLEDSLDVTDATLEEAGRRMRELAAPWPAGDVAFGVRAAPDLSDAELELLETLGIVEAPAEMDSFSVLSGLPRMPWEEARTELRELLEQVRRLSTHFAWVETKVGDALVARTAVSLSGDFQAVWPASVGSEGRRLHQRSLALALRSRLALVQTVAVITSGAVVLLPRLTTPAAAVAALPAIWRYIVRVRTELERARQMREER